MSVMDVMSMPKSIPNNKGRIVSVVWSIGLVQRFLRPSLVFLFPTSRWCPGFVRCDF
jgi:hypothetical protein